MKFKIDENLPADFAALFRSAGFEAHTIADEELSAASDAVLFSNCRAEGRVLVTLDLDFSNLRAYPPGTHPGIVVIRTKSQDRNALFAIMRRVVEALKLRSPTGQLWIVEQGRIRIRE